jgi:ketosteroid isomerase-like protein
MAPLSRKAGSAHAAAAAGHEQRPRRGGPHAAGAPPVADAPPAAARGPVGTVTEFWRLMAGNDFRAVAAVLADDFVLEWPQSNERIRGAEAFARMNAAYPAHGPWRFEVQRLFGDAAQAVSAVRVGDGVQQALALSFFEVAGGRIRRLVEYWPEPYAPPPWRAGLAEPIA